MVERLIEFALRNRLLMVIVAAAVLIGGAVSYEQLPINAFPDV